MMRLSYPTDLIEVAEAEFLAGKTDISASQLVALVLKLPPPARPLEEPPIGIGGVFGGELYRSARGKLPALKKALEEKGYAVCLIGKTYYLGNGRQSYQTTPPTTDEEARFCLPNIGESAYGIHLRTGIDDLIYLASLKRDAASGGGKLKHMGEKVIEGMDAALITDGAADQLLDYAVSMARPAAERLNQLRGPGAPSLPPV